MRLGRLQRLLAVHRLAVSGALYAALPFQDSPLGREVRLAWVRRMLRVLRLASVSGALHAALPLPDASLGGEVRLARL